MGAEQMRSLVAQFGDGRDLRARIVADRLATEPEIAQAVARQAGIPFVDLTQEPLSSEVVSMIPAMLCRRYQLIPVRMTRRNLLVGMVDPSNLIAIDDIATATGLSIAPVAIAADALELAFGRFLRTDNEMNELSGQMAEESSSHESGLEDGVDETAEDAPVVRFVSLLISQAIDDRASDIHIEPGEKKLIVRYRIDGVLQETQQADRAIQNGVISRLKIMAAVDIAERRKPQDGRISVRHNGKKVDLRLATLPTVWGEKIVMRILANSTEKMTLRDLSFSKSNEQLFKEAIARPYGMVLVTGPTGSGKSTTLYTALGEIATPQVNAITVEDPVEFRLAGINQVQVNHKAGLNFHTALRSILRSDPDIVMVGEIRDQETANMSIEAALTGHMVLSTLHTNDAPSALTRFINMGCEPFLVGTAINAVVAQRLARKLCTKCREPYSEDPQKLLALKIPYDPAGQYRFYRPVGCAECSQTGYRGRVALHEVMMMTEELEHLVTEHATSSELRAAALRDGMVTLRQDGFEKAAQGVTTIEEVLRVSA
ncbi:MAG: Flp pilus assembly complex ATPase component TadA [Actinobacteria bacterium]|nr:Flp pilus assembly complex ATPase component TadA [Actinomycetota bacterium]